MLIAVFEGVVLLDMVAPSSRPLQTLRPEQHDCDKKNEGQDVFDIAAKEIADDRLADAQQERGDDHALVFAEASKREAGFMIQALAVAVLLFGALGRIVWVMVTTGTY